MGTLNDPRGQQVDELAFEAERLERQGDAVGARALYTKAAGIETALARATASDAPRVRGLLAISAVSLWMRAEAYAQAESLADEFACDPGVPQPARAELMALVDPVRGQALQQRYARLAAILETLQRREQVGVDFDPDSIERLRLHKAA